MLLARLQNIHQARCMCAEPARRGSRAARTQPPHPRLSRQPEHQVILGQGAVGHIGCLRVLCAHLVVAGQTLLIEDGLLDQLVEVVREYPAIDFGYYLGRGTLESGTHRL